MSRNLLIVGAGQLGSRHLQAFSNLSNNYKISIVDPSVDSLKVAEDRYLESASTTSPSVCFFDSIDALIEKEFLVVVIATSASVRLSVVRQLTENLKIQYLILEKVLFQSTEQLHEAQQLLTKAGIKAWVNCPRRQFIAYQQLKARYLKADSVSLTVNGSNWGLACNAIHFIDLWHYLSDFHSYNLKFESNARIIDSKRNGYKELLGTLNASSDDGKHQLSLTCSDYETSFLEIKANFDGDQVVLAEHQGDIKWLDKNEDILEVQPLKVLFQSELTDKVIHELLNTGDCSLTKFEVSKMLHAEFLSKIVDVFSISEKNNGLAPIT